MRESTGESGRGSFYILCRFERLLFLLTDAFVTRRGKKGKASPVVIVITLFRYIFPVPICIAAMIISTFFFYYFHKSLFFFSKFLASCFLLLLSPPGNCYFNLFGPRNLSPSCYIYIYSECRWERSCRAVHLAPFDTWCAHRISGVDKKKSGSPRSISISIVDLSLGYQLFYATKEARLFFFFFLFTCRMRFWRLDSSFTDGWGDKFSRLSLNRENLGIKEIMNLSIAGRGRIIGGRDWSKARIGLDRAAGRWW